MSFRARSAVTDENTRERKGISLNDAFFGSVSDDGGSNEKTATSADIHVYRTCNSTLGVAVLASPAFAADVPKMQPLMLSKDCSQFSGGVPSSCTVLESNLPALKKGTKILYYGPVNDNPTIMSSNVVLDNGAGDTAMGNCIVDNGAGPKGVCAFYAGSGALAGFSAIVQVTVDAKQVWHWDGSYAISASAEATK